MTDDTNADLRAAAEKATPGPWWLNDGEPWAGDESLTRYLDTGVEDDEAWARWDESDTGSLFHGDVVHAPDAAFIAAANPARVLALIAENDRLRAAVERVEEGTYHVRGSDGCESSPATGWGDSPNCWCPRSKREGP